jgi:hyperosmotically inducible periplasmic protein
MRRNCITMSLILALVLPALGRCAQPATQATEQDRTVGQTIDDAMITTRIKTTYLFNGHLNSFKINVDTKDGVVTLQGVVKTDIQKDLAGEIAKNANGVKSVRNELRAGEGAVEDPEEIDRTFSQGVLDATTTASVKTALALAKGVKASELTVTTRWGTVTITGHVATKAEKDLAEKTARQTMGVKDVVNNIQVSG